MYPIIKDLLKSNSSNRDLCDTKTELSVIMECSNQINKLIPSNPIMDEDRYEVEQRYEMEPPIMAERTNHERPMMDYRVDVDM